MNMTSVFTLMTCFLLTIRINGAEFKWELEEDEGIPVLTTENFDTFIGMYDLVFVKFYAPWCGHCKKMIPDYAQLASVMHEEGGVPIVKVDATVETSIAGRYGISGYPSLKLFRRGSVLDYKGERTYEPMYDWVKTKTGPISKELYTEEEVNEFASNEDISLLYILQPGDDRALESFLSFANRNDDVIVAHTFNTDIAKKFELKFGFNLVMFRSFDDGNRFLSNRKPLTQDEMAMFLSNNRFPIIMDLNKKSGEKIFGSTDPAMFLLVKDRSVPEVEVFKRVGEERYNKGMFFVIADIEEETGKKVAEMVGVTEDNVPAVRIIKKGQKGLDKYMVTDTTEKGLKRAMDQALANKLKTYYKSAPIPKDNDKGVKIIVGDNFKKEIVDSGKVVLFEAYAPWCGHCKKLEPIYEELATRLQEHDDVVIAKMDATQNEYPGLDIKGYPHIILYRPGYSEPVTFENERNFEEMLKFVELYAGRELLEGEQRNFTPEE